MGLKALTEPTPLRARAYWLMPCAAMAREVLRIERSAGKKSADKALANWVRGVSQRLALQLDPETAFEEEIHAATDARRLGGAPIGNQNAKKRRANA